MDFICRALRQALVDRCQHPPQKSASKHFQAGSLSPTICAALLQNESPNPHGKRRNVNVVLKANLLKISSLQCTFMGLPICLVRIYPCLTQLFVLSLGTDFTPTLKRTELFCVWELAQPRSPCIIRKALDCHRCSLRLHISCMLYRTRRSLHNTYQNCATH